jgi:truncated hemoglobin YjbI
MTGGVPVLQDSHGTEPLSETKLNKRFTMVERRGWFRDPYT